jgi:hypothetical protein
MSETFILADVVRFGKPTWWSASLCAIRGDPGEWGAGAPDQDQLWIGGRIRLALLQCLATLVGSGTGSANARRVWRSPEIASPNVLFGFLQGPAGTYAVWQTGTYAIV